MSLSAGARLGPYEILSPLGAGGMGEVYKARDTRLDRLVAVKVSREQFSERFEREARAVAALNHPHICTLHDVGPNFLVMEYIEGTSLKGPLPPVKAVEYAEQILDALDVAHGKSIVHRDLKPSNIMVTERGIKLLDFGLAKMQRDFPPDAETALSLTQAGAVIGTPAYMSPEQWQGKPADVRTDIYAFGCVFYEMLTGKRVAQERVPVKPAALESVLRTCLQPDPEDRWQSARDVKRHIVGVLARRRRMTVAMAAAVTMALAVAGTVLWQRVKAAPLTDKDVVVLADFTNSTGDSVFDVTLREALAAQLEKSPFLKILSDDQVREGLRLMGREPREPITSQVAREVCQRGRQKAMIGGSIASLGRIYAITLRATDCQSGDTLAREQTETEDKEHVLRAVAAVASQLRARLGESLSSIQTIDRRDNLQVTTPSLEAFQAYALGREQDNRTMWLSAIAFYQRSTELDPTFAMAYLLLGQKYGNLQEVSRRREYFKKAYAMIDRVSERERLLISGLYYNQVTLEQDKAAEIWQSHMRLYPRDSSPHNYLGIYYTQRGEYGKGVEQFQEAIRLDPWDAVFRGNLVWALESLNRYDEAKAAAQQAFDQNVDGLVIHRRLLHLAYVQGNRAAADKEISKFAGTPQEYQSLNLQADDANARGRRAEAREFTQRAVELTRRRNLPETATLLLTSAAEVESVMGNCDAALDRARALIPPDPEPDNTAAVAFTLAFCGDVAQAQKLLDEVHARFPNATLWNQAGAPYIRAAMALSSNQPAKALDLLSSPDAGLIRGPTHSVSRYLQALAHLRLRHGVEAAAAFQSVLDHKSAHWGGGGPGGVYGLLYAPSLVGAARAMVMMGDTTKANKTYQDFLELWKDADPGIPILKHAQAEYAKLQQ